IPYGPSAPRARELAPTRIRCAFALVLLLVPILLAAIVSVTTVDTMENVFHHRKMMLQGAEKTRSGSGARTHASPPV
ncbi:hypothetical protein PFISCL1PPCAC_838, partial [Pristionchus fissidentatus]